MCSAVRSQILFSTGLAVFALIFLTAAANTRIEVEHNFDNQSPGLSVAPSVQGPAKPASPLVMPSENRVTAPKQPPPAYFSGERIEQIGLNVLGGVITVLLCDRFRRLLSVLRRRKFQKVFGRDAVGVPGVYLVYGPMVLATPVRDDQGKIDPFPYRKPETVDSGKRFSITLPVNSSALRAMKYLSETIGIEAGQSAQLSSDEELRGRLDVSFISIGGLNNFKTLDALDNEGNQLISFDGFKFASRKSRRHLVSCDPGYDYGLILKCHPIQFPDRAWFVCAGRGEWGTSGAARCLAKKWRRIAKQFGPRNFAMIIRVRPDQDESAEPVAFGASGDDIERLARMAEVEIQAQP